MWAIRIAIAGFIVPFMAVYNPALMMQGGDWGATLYMLFKAAFAVGLWGAVFTGYLQRPMALWEKVLAFAAAASMVLAMPISDEIGFGLGALFLIQHFWRARRAEPAAA
jgi:TRAP-type uncharacterized transport system fused permease subunit